MIEIVSSYFDFIINSQANPLSFTIIGAITGSLLYYWTKIYSKKLDNNKELETRRLEIQENEKKANVKILESIQSSLCMQQGSVNESTQINKQLMQTLDRVNSSLSDLSNRFLAHDERSLRITDALDDIRSNMSTMNSVDKIHNKIENLQASSSSKDDIYHILDMLTSVDLKATKMAEILTEIKTKIMF